MRVEDFLLFTFFYIRDISEMEKFPVLGMFGFAETLFAEITQKHFVLKAHVNVWCIGVSYFTLTDWGIILKDTDKLSFPLLGHNVSIIYLKYRFPINCLQLFYKPFWIIIFQLS